MAKIYRAKVVSVERRIKYDANVDVVACSMLEAVEMASKIGTVMEVRIASDAPGDTMFVGEDC